MRLIKQSCPHEVYAACCFLLLISVCWLQPRGVNVQPTVIAVVPADLQVNPQGVNVAPFGIAAVAGKK